jgi:hypothetical protein
LSHVQAITEAQHIGQVVTIEDPDTPNTGDDVAQIRKDYPKIFDVRIWFRFALFLYGDIELM